LENCIFAEGGVEYMGLFAKPAIVSPVTLASVPPVTMASASPASINRIAIPIASVADAHADVIV
jgi:hypothetical protein